MTLNQLVLICILLAGLVIFHKTLLQTNTTIESDNEPSQYSDYNASVEFVSRRLLLERTCAQFSDKFRPEYKSIFQTKPPLNKFSFFQNSGKSYIMCNILKGGSNSWKSFMDQLQKELQSKAEKQPSENNQVLNSLDSMVGNMDSVTPVTESCWPKCAATSVNLIQVRHPLERLLSAWRYVFQREGSYKDDSLVADSLKDVLGRRDTRLEWTTFVQKVVIQNKMKTTNKEGAQKSQNEPDIWVKNHWAPYWFTCGVCRAELMPRYILHMETLDKDLDQLLEDIGLEGVETKYPHVLKGADGHSSSHLQYYYSQLTKDQVNELYNIYKMDHLLFGYSPDEFLTWAQ